MAKKRPEDGKKLVRGTGYYALSIVIAFMVIIMIGAIIWGTAAIFIYDAAHFSAIIGWVLFGSCLMTYLLLKAIRTPFGKKLDADSLQKGGDIVGAAAAVAAIVAEPSFLTGDGGEGIEKEVVRKWGLIVFEILIASMLLGIPLLFLNLTGGDLAHFFSSPFTSKPTFLCEASMLGWLILYIGYRSGSPIKKIIRIMIWGKKFA